MSNKIEEKRIPYKRDKAFSQLESLIKQFGQFYELPKNQREEHEKLFAKSNSIEIWNEIPLSERAITLEVIADQISTSNCDSYWLGIPFEGFFFSGFKISQFPLQNMIHNLTDLPLTDLLIVCDGIKKTYFISEGEDGWAFFEINTFQT